MSSSFQLFVYRSSGTSSLIVTVDGDHVRAVTVGAEETPVADDKLEALAGGNPIQQDIALVVKGFAGNIDELEGMVSYRPEDCAFAVHQQVRRQCGQRPEGADYTRTNEGDDEDTFFRPVTIDTETEQKDADQRRRFAQSCRVRILARGIPDQRVSEMISASGPELAARATDVVFAVAPDQGLLAVLLAVLLSDPQVLAQQFKRVRATLIACSLPDQQLPRQPEALLKFVMAAHLALIDKMSC